MVFRSYNFQIVLRVILVLINCLLIGYLIPLMEQRLLLINLFVLLFIQGFLLVRYHKKWHDDISKFFTAIRHKDYTLVFNPHKNKKEFQELYKSLNYINDFLRTVRAENEKQYQYFQYVVENAQVALIAFNDAHKIILYNQVAENFFNLNNRENMDQLNQKDPDFYNSILNLKPLQAALLHFKGNDAVIKLSVRLSKFRIEDQNINLLSLQNIRSELEETELKTWQELISVLTHEIMNSVAPISSLSGTINHQLSLVEGNEAQVDKIKRGLEVIFRRSAELMKFVDNYRKISTLPLPQKEDVKVMVLIRSILKLMEAELEGVEVEINAGDVSVFADRFQIEQVLINILKNALHAVEENDRKKIKFKAEEEDNQIILHIRDNGKGIPEEMMDKIFIPFFTTKTNGSGIGLAFSRQIMHNNNGKILVQSKVGDGTEVKLMFER